MNIFQLECFITLAHYLNFTKAAAHMNITQPAFSRHISIIENELGVSLFFRNKREVYLTNAGEVFLKVGKNILDEYKEGVAKAVKAEKGLIGSIKIGVLQEQFNCLLPNAINKFKDSYPNIGVEIAEYSNSTMINALQDYKIDVGFTITAGLAVIEDIIWESQMTFEHSVVLPIDHPLANRTCIDVLELMSEKFIMLEPDDYSSINQITLEICGAAHFTPCVVQIASSFGGLMTFVECGSGISIVPYHFKEQFPHNVKFIRLSAQPCKVERIFAWRKSNLNPCLPLFIRKTICNNNF